MVKTMGILNLTPDSFWEPSRYGYAVLDACPDILDVGAVSTRPGADPVSLDEEWNRLESFLKSWAAGELFKTFYKPQLSIDTTRAEIVRRAYDCVGPFMVNDISAGEDDPEMLPLVGELDLPYVAMHKRGNPKTMDTLTDYSEDIIEVLLDYFRDFERRAAQCGIVDWILDPGLGFAKTDEQNWAILEGLERLKVLGRPILIGASNKRFTHGDTARANKLAVEHGANILRVHVPADTAQPYQPI